MWTHVVSVDGAAERELGEPGLGEGVEAGGECHAEGLREGLCEPAEVDGLEAAGAPGLLPRLDEEDLGPAHGARHAHVVRAAVDVHALYPVHRHPVDRARHPAKHGNEGTF